jgi:hypothetical protein
MLKTLNPTRLERNNNKKRATRNAKLGTQTYE